MSKRFVMRRSAFFILSALAGAAWGQEASFDLGEVVVSAPRPSAPPLGAEDVDQDTLATLRPATSDTASLLRDVPGLSLYGAGGVSSLPVVHGLADDRLRIKVDGMDLIAACPNHMNSPLSYIDPSNVATARVFAGITPVSVGGDAIGGTILVDSPDPEFAGTGQGTLHKGEAGVFYRSNGDAWGGHLSAEMANETVSVRYNGSYVESGDYKAGGGFKAAGPAADGRGGLDGDEVGSSAYKSQNHSLGLAMRRDKQLLELKVGVQHIPYEGFPNQRMDMTQNDSTQVDLRYKGQYRWGLLEARAYHEKTRHKMDFGDDKEYWYPSVATCEAAGYVIGATCAAGMPMDTEGKNTGAAVKADIVLSDRDLLRLGGEYQSYRLNDWWLPSGKGMWPNTFWNIHDGQRDRFDVYGEWEARWNPQWMSQIGVRSDTVTTDAGTVSGYNATYDADAGNFNSADRHRTDNNWDLTVLARFTPDATRTLEFGYARKTRSPNLYERYSWSTGTMAMVMNNFVGDGNGYVGNLDLKPEVANTVSLTADWHDADKERWGLRVTPYYTYIQDYIDARCLTDGCSTTGFLKLTYANQSARLYGMDVSGYYPLASTSRFGNFIASGGLNYVDGENRTTGDNLYNIMPLNAKLAVTQRLGKWTNTLEGQFVAGKKDVSQVRNEIATGGYSLFNLRSSYAWKHMRLDFGVENLFDKFYNAPLGGAYVGQGKTMSITGVPWGIAVPGPGRSFYTALSGKF